MLLRGEVLGALNVLWNEPDAAPDDPLAVQAFAHMAAIGILQAPAIQQAA